LNQDRRILSAAKDCLAIGGMSIRPSVCPSVRSSHAGIDSKLMIVQFSPSGRPWLRVFWYRLLHPRSHARASNETDMGKNGEKNAYFAPFSWWWL